MSEHLDLYHRLKGAEARMHMVAPVVLMCQGDPAEHTCTATDVSAPNIKSSRPMSHLDPSETKISPGLRPTCA